MRLEMPEKPANGGLFRVTFDPETVSTEDEEAFLPERLSLPFRGWRLRIASIIESRFESSLITGRDGRCICLRGGASKK